MIKCSIFHNFTLTRLYKYILPLIIIIFIYLAFQGLDNNYFWSDEAEVAIFSKNLLDFGQLTAWDGRNLFAQRNGAHINNNFINSWSPPLQFYITALSFYLFGISTWTARFPFVLLGCFSLPILLLILNELKIDKSNILLAISIYALSVPLLLYIRQCRYYALIIFFSLCLYYFYLKFLHTQKKVFLVGMGMSAVLLFYSHYLAAVTFCIALIGNYLIYHFRQKDIRYFAIVFIAVVFLTLPYIIRFNPFAKISEVTLYSSGNWFINKIILLFRYFRELNNLDWFPWVIAIGLIYYSFISKRKHQLVKLAKEWLLLALFVTVSTVILSPQSVVITKRADMRYIVTLLPFLASLIALFLCFISHKNKVLFIILFSVIIFSNILSLTPFRRKLQFDLVDYITEVHNDYVTSFEAVDSFLEFFAHQDDLVYVYPPRMNEPILFYKGDKIRLCGLLNSKTSLPKDKIRKLNPHLFIEECIPDWIIVFGRYQSLPEDLFKRLLQQEIKYELFDVLKVFWQDFTRPPGCLLHLFKPIDDFNPFYEGILIYRKVN
jgi:hypothetical protein